MTSSDLGTPDGPGAPRDFGLSGDSALPGDLGLLSPMRGAARETGDAAAITAAARTVAFDLPGLAGRARSGGNLVIPLVDDLREAARQEKR
ncbi:hypothetical protein [Streptosporangium sp. CA-115845]|uniref:hypothetical protein n=1 Tax=Streptosporangium sp. CA-115845 TaxID=3240071 RepID=UPI003D9490D7